jgi:16S rRNA (cytidine1402-2'-O)-methyltransferase
MKSQLSEGKLVVVGTPIGNLGDISARALEALRSANWIAAEDTRVTRKLLDRYEISVPLLSHHKFNEASRQQEWLDKMRQGQIVALVSDAGMPGVADPGERLVQACRREGVAVEVIPGPSAVLHALVASGFPALPFSFHGFLPVKSGGRRRDLEMARDAGHTVIFFESPYRLMKTLEGCREIMPERLLCVARELTKKFEETRVGTPEELIEHFGAKKIKGEITLVISGKEGR